MSWQREVDELNRRAQLAEQMGGEEKVGRQLSRGKLTARERIRRLLDEGSFQEVGKLAGRGEYDADGALTDFTPANFIAGRGRIDSRPVVVGVDDFTVRGGAADAAIAGKQIIAERMAKELRLPLLRLLDGTGGGGSVKSLDAPGARTYVPANPAWDLVVDNLVEVPVVSLLLGPVAGLGAARAVSSHYSIMVKGLSQLFVAGPPVVARLGEDLSKEELGGYRIHTRNGAVDDVVESEDEAFGRARRFLSYLPASVHALPERTACDDPAQRSSDWLLEAIPRDRRQVFDVRRIVEEICDAGSVFEIGRFFGRSLMTALVRVNGWPMALMASDPYHYGGGWSDATSQKAMRFVELAETFHLPVINLVDNPGFVIGLAAEKAATIRHGARALATIYRASVPWCSVILRKVFGVAGAGHSNHSRLQYRMAWPSGDWGSLPVEGGIEAAYTAELADSDDPEALQAKILERLNAVRSPMRTAEAFMVEDIIDPRETRARLCEFAELAAPLRTPQPGALHYRP
ncbi:MAG: methylmalonyl-CoA carboxyltransferase [Gammaproteobacteria bacterium AqS3]|nr:methylmalonyl-CoA carboxyltransferase [Gammaproteobacteria bacterium AqS3]